MRARDADAYDTSRALRGVAMRARERGRALRGVMFKAVVLALLASSTLARAAATPGEQTQIYPRAVEGTFKGDWWLDARSYANASALTKAGLLGGACTLQVRSRFDETSRVQSIVADMVLRKDEYVSVQDVHVPLEGVYAETSGALYMQGEEKTTESFLSVTNSSAFDSYFDESAYRRAMRTIAVDIIGTPRERIRGAKLSSIESKDSYHRNDGVTRQGRVSRAKFISEGTVGTYPRVCSFKLHGYVNPGAFTTASPTAFREYGQGTADRNRDQEDLGDVLDEQMEDVRPLDFGDMSSEAVLVGKFVSDNCGITVHLKLKSQSVKVFYRKVRFYTYFLILTLIAQGYILLQQIDESSTPSSMMRISIATVGMRSVIDSYFCLTHLTMGILIDDLFAPLGVVSAGYFILFSILEMRLLVQAWRTRRPHIQGWLELRTDISAVYSRFYAAFMFGLLLMYWTANKFIWFLAFLNSYWIPQIIRNAYYNQRQALKPSYVVLTSYLRLVIPLYALGCPSNFMHLRPNFTHCFLLVAWTTAQVVVLMCQHYIDPRYGVGDLGIFPEVYDYHRRVSEDVLAQCGFIEGDDAASERDIEMGDVTSGADCVICMNHVKIRTPSERMVTPCNHFFHTECLTRWIDIKQECPTCRRALPPL